MATQLLGLPMEDEAELCRVLCEQASWAPVDAFAMLGNNLTVTPELYAEVVRRVAAETARKDRRAADFVVAFGSEVIKERDKNRIEYTDLCFITGSGHQHFLGAARGLAESVGPEHIGEALFGPWRYSDKGLSMRWDPDDAKEYALRWRDPSIGGASSVWGANRLAFEALPLFPTVPRAKRLRTTGFQRHDRVHEFTWPLWTQPASMDTVRSLLGLRELREASPDRVQLQALGVEEVYRVQRVRIGQGANFKVSFRPARAV